MKRYASRISKCLAVVSLICGAVFLIGIILVFVSIENNGLPIGLIGLGGFLGIIFFLVFLLKKAEP